MDAGAGRKENGPSAGPAIAANLLIAQHICR
jgi:hypothetical protein